MGKKFQDKIKPEEIQLKTRPKPVELLAIPIKALPAGLILPAQNKSDERLLVFTGAVSSSAKNIFYSHQGFLRDAGYQQQDRAIKVLLPQVHNIKGRRSDNRNFATAQSVATEEIKEKFPNAKINYVNSVEELADKYKALVAERKQALGLYDDGRQR